jgi:hypothetical protein
LSPSAPSPFSQIRGNILQVSHAGVQARERDSCNSKTLRELNYITGFWSLSPETKLSFSFPFLLHLFPFLFHFFPFLFHFFSFLLLYLFSTHTCGLLGNRGSPQARILHNIYRTHRNGVCLIGLQIVKCV